MDKKGVIRRTPVWSVHMWTMGGCMDGYKVKMGFCRHRTRSVTDHTTIEILIPVPRVIELVSCGMSSVGTEHSITGSNMERRVIN